MEFQIPANYFDLLGKARKSYGRALEPVCRQWGLTRNELDVLLFLHNNPAFDRAADIVRHRGMAKSHVSLSVSALEERALLLRCNESTDRRNAHLRLTEAGTAIAEQGRRAQQAYFCALLAGISPEELAVWQRICQTIGQNINDL